MSNNAKDLVIAFPNDSYIFNYASFEGHGVDGEKVDLVDNLSPKVVKEPHAFDKGYLSDCCRFAQILVFCPLWVMLGLAMILGSRMISMVVARLMLPTKDDSVCRLCYILVFDA